MSILVQPSPAARKQADRRVDHRYATAVHVEVVARDGIVVAGEIENISCSGFRMRSPVIMSRGSKVLVRMRGLRRQAKVIWQDGPFMGCRFVRHLPADVLGAVLAAAG